MSWDPQTQTSLRREPQDVTRNLTVEGNYEIPVHIQVVAIAPDQGAVTLELPNVDLCGGRHCSIHLRDPGAAGTASVATVSGRGLVGTYTLDAAGEAILFYSDGIKWFVVANNIA